MADHTQPGYLRSAGILLIVFAVLNGAGFVIPLPEGTSDSLSRSDILHAVADVTVCLIAGLGLVARRRWGWAVAVMAALANLVLGLLAVAHGIDIAFPMQIPLLLALVVTPAALLTGALFSRGSLAWVTGRSAKKGASDDELEPRPDQGLPPV